MTVHFIGAGPGAADLITVRGLRLIERCPVCIYAGSLVPKEVVAGAPKEAHLVDSSALTLDEIIAEMEAAHAQGLDVARVHSGDPSIYGAMAEQMRRLDGLGIPYDVTPGVPAFAAAAAAMKQELTIPGVNQSIILTRTSMKSSAMPEGENLAIFGRSGATLVIHLSIRNLANIEAELIPLYGADCPVVVAYRIGWPDEQILRGTLSDIAAKVEVADLKRTAMIFVGRGLDPKNFRDSALYHEAHSHAARSKTEG
ncbi:precorrin-4/cobalt-precorrin-4 C11-methyltransferase [Ochrobactrum daejeonense]|uniref:Precorrin-4/cobalt-precorrin-4 C11-methyltransferase n=1 Tax=Brucella daejeonensis TaxID=659015 RepID=A0A7W9EMF7_9HYPH|nr:precorrin-4 C(11)-methyltransferase [Brucella daejeonensis]MBB5701671.1 precorrin-4/cobalt-precorrin-4 C11-methyltransferase [Brucella daejeonensis]